MARSHGIVKTSIWTDTDFRALTAGAQRAYLLLISQPQINNCGVLPYVPRRWVKMAADCTLDALEDSLDELEQGAFIVVDEDTEELLVRTFIRHDRIARQPNLVKAAQREFGEIESRTIRHVLFRLNQPIFEPLPEPLTEGLSEPLPEPLSARTRVRSRAHTRTAPTPSPKGPLVSEVPLGEDVSADTPGARDAPPEAAHTAPPAPPAAGANGNHEPDRVLVAYNAAARWLRAGGYLEQDWRYRIDVDFGVTDDIELAGLTELQQQLAATEVEA